MPKEVTDAALIAQLEGGQSAINKGTGGGNSVTPKVREEALAGFKAAEGLARRVTEMRGLFAEGPGATSGLAGLADYNPYALANQRFDRAGSAARGYVGQALGFTGGQLNTPTEAAQAVGPYLPTASDRDEVAKDKIERLEGLANDARERSIAILGGVPDAMGRITPLTQEAPPLTPTSLVSPPTTPSAGPPPPAGMDGTTRPLVPGGAAPQMGFSGSSGFKTVADPAQAGVNARVNGMMQSGKSADEIRAYLASVGAPGAADAALAFRAKHPGYRGPYSVDLENRQIPMSAGQTVLNAVGSGPVGAYFASAADGITAGTLDNMTANPALARATMDGISAQNPFSSLAGAVSGGALATSGAELGLGALGARLGGGLGRALSSARTADGLYGAAAGAGSADGGDRLTGAGVGALAGVGGGIFGRAAARGAGNIATGVRNPAVQYLRDAGIPLTVGQTLGGPVKSIEDRLTGLPVVGDVVNNRRREGFEGFNRAAFAQALAPIGATTNGAIREAGVDAARASRSQAYRDALGGVQVQADAPFVADMGGAIRAGRALPDPMSGNLDYTLPTRVGNSFGPNGELTGDAFQQSIRGLRRDAKSMEALPYGHDFGDVTRQAEAALEGLLQRQSPGTLPAYQAANTANRNVEIVRDAVNRGRSGTRVGDPGLFAPSQLSDAAAANSKRFGGTQGTTAQPFFDLTRAGQRVLPSSVPDSGTAGRLAVTGGLAALGGGGAGVGYLGGDTKSGTAGGLGVGALLALGGTRAGQRQLTRLLADRPDLALRIGEQIQRNARIGGMFGAGAAPVLLPRP